MGTICVMDNSHCVDWLWDEFMQVTNFSYHVRLSHQDLILLDCQSGERECVLLVDRVVVGRVLTSISNANFIPIPICRSNLEANLRVEKEWRMSLEAQLQKEKDRNIELQHHHRRLKTLESVGVAMATEYHKMVADPCWLIVITSDIYRFLCVNLLSWAIAMKYIWPCRIK